MKDECALGIHSRGAEMIIDFTVGMLGTLGIVVLIWKYQEYKKTSKNEEMLDRAGNLLQKVLCNVPLSHGIFHALKVLEHTYRALKQCPELTDNTKLAIMLAALLHDADDRKYFPKNKSYENARMITRQICPQAEDLVIEMIGYVSCSSNGSSIPSDAMKRPWLLYPRWADRLEAIGYIGIVRAWEYTLETNRPLFTATTQRARNVDELGHIANADRYTDYVSSGGKSASMIDHYYDKLLHICDFETDNIYLRDKARERRNPLVNICLIFGEHGQLDIDLFDRARRRTEYE